MLPMRTPPPLMLSDGVWGLGEGAGLGFAAFDQVWHRRLSTRSGTQTRLDPEPRGSRLMKRSRGSVTRGALGPPHSPVSNPLPGFDDSKNWNEVIQRPKAVYLALCLLHPAKIV